MQSNLKNAKEVEFKKYITSFFMGVNNTWKHRWLVSTSIIHVVIIVNNAVQQIITSLSWCFFYCIAVIREKYPRYCIWLFFLIYFAIYFWYIVSAVRIKTIIEEISLSELDLAFNPFSHSGHCIGQPSKISILVQEGIIKKISYERSAMSRRRVEPILGYITKKYEKRNS